jgi:hypothetical protein
MIQKKKVKSACMKHLRPLQKTLDNLLGLCYNTIRKKKGDKTMTKNSNVLIIIVIVLVAAGVLGTLVVYYSRLETGGEYYALTTRVEDVNEATDLVLVEDSNGSLWAFKGVEDWQIGDCASLLMWDNGTENIKDDEIISARYNSWDLERN